MPDQPKLIRALAEKYTAAWCSQNAVSVASFYEENGSLRVNDDPPAVGRAAITEVAQGFMTAFPDLKVSMDDVRLQDEGAVITGLLREPTTDLVELAAKSVLVATRSGTSDQVD